MLCYVLCFVQYPHFPIVLPVVLLALHMLLVMGFLHCRCSGRGRDFCSSVRLFCGDTEAFMRLLLKVVFQKSPIEQVKFLALLLVGLIKCLF